MWKNSSLSLLCALHAGKVIDKNTENRLINKYSGLGSLREKGQGMKSREVEFLLFLTSFARGGHQ